MVRKAFLLIAAALATACIVAAPAAAAPNPAVKSVAAVLETAEFGQIVIGARIEYAAEVKAEDIKFDKTYLVYGFPIVATYVNNDGAWDNAQPSGKYVFLKFSVDQVPGSMKGRTSMKDGFKVFKLDVHLGILQLLRIPLSDGGVATPCGLTNDSEINLEVEEYKKVSFTDSKGHTISYRLYIPKGYETKKADLKNLPIVFYLHGGGDFGPGDDIQMTAAPSALEFSRPASQAKNPCFVLAPQGTERTENGGYWADYPDPERSKTFVGRDLNAALEALKSVMDTYNVDANRVYGTGLSAGSRGTLAASIAYPDLYAAHLLIASCDVYTDDEVRHLAKKPLWFVLAADEAEERMTKMPAAAKQLERLGAKVNWKIGADAMNGFLRGYKASQQAKAQIDEAKASGQNILFTHLVAGTVIDDSHWSWVWTYNNEAIRDWMFAQSK